MKKWNFSMDAVLDSFKTRSFRVGGYSIQFVQLNSIAQDEIISRYV